MKALITFVWDMLGKKVVNDSYEGLKQVLGSSLLSTLEKKCQDGNREAFEDNMKRLLSNSELKEQLQSLMEGKRIERSLNRIKNSNINIKLGNGKMIDSANDTEGSTIEVS
jgi:hypothetical protein